MILAFSITEATSKDIDIIDELLVYLMRSKTSHSLFHSMSY